MEARILVTGLNPVIQKTIVLPSLTEDAVNRAEYYLIDASGKAVNVCRILGQLGYNPVCLSPLGKPNGEEFADLAQKDGIRLLTALSSVRTRNCYTLINREKGTATEVISDEQELVEQAVEAQILKLFASLITDIDILVITGSKAKGFSDNIIPAMVKSAKHSGVTVFCDYRGKDLLNSFFNPTSRPDYVKINKDELLMTFPNIDPAEKIKELAEQYSSTFIITDGENETIYRGPAFHGVIQPERVRSVNHIGCGDTFLAGIVDSFIRGKSLEESVNYAGSLASKNALNLRPGSLI